MIIIKQILLLIEDHYLLVSIVICYVNNFFQNDYVGI